MEELKDLLEEEIKAQIEDLPSLPSGSEEKSAAVEAVAKLYKLRIEETKNEQDRVEKEAEAAYRGLDQDLKQDQLDEQVKDRYMRLGIAAAELILPLLFYACWMRRGFRFEETGAYTSTTFRGLFNRFKPTKK